jgi:hypothetical protein
MRNFYSKAIGFLLFALFVLHETNLSIHSQIEVVLKSSLVRNEEVVTLIAITITTTIITCSYRVSFNELGSDLVPGGHHIVTSGKYA